MSDFREKRAAEIQNAIRQILYRTGIPLESAVRHRKMSTTPTSEEFTGYWRARGQRRLWFSSLRRQSKILPALSSRRPTLCS